MTKYERILVIVIPNLIGNPNALAGFIGCIKIPACAGMTTVFLKSVIGNLVQNLDINTQPYVTSGA